MKLEEFERLLDAHGADPARWPDARRDAALALLADDPEAAARHAETRGLDTLLDTVASAPVDAATVDRIVRAAVAAPSGFSWPLRHLAMQAAGLAACLVLGLAIGVSGIAETSVVDVPEQDALVLVLGPSDNLFEEAFEE